MRFLFVYQDYAEPARKLLDELQVDDVTLIIARKNAQAPTDDEVTMLNKHAGADAAACGINRKYRKRAAEFLTFCCEPKKFRFEDQQLREWLVPKGRIEVSRKKPSDAFRAAAQRSAALVLHPDALNHADELVEHRWRFAETGAALLARYAAGEQLRALREWKQKFAVDFAANGRVSFKYKWTCESEYREGKTEWHLKEGDNTTRESAARIYFARVEFSGGARVVVLYVGPHPDDGERTLTFAAP
jgi:hypothetical protein